MATFDYRDLTQYLLFATGQLYPDEDHLSIFQALAKKAQQGFNIPLQDAKSLGNKEPFVTLPHTADLTKAVETFGGGVHRIVVVKEGTNDAIGILSQVRLVKFLWENGRSFPIIDRLYPQNLKDLGIGSQHLISIKYVVPRNIEKGLLVKQLIGVWCSGDKPLKEALKLMNNEGLTSLAVVDNVHNVVGNISNTDVKVNPLLQLLISITQMHQFSFIVVDRKFKSEEKLINILSSLPNLVQPPFSKILASTSSLSFSLRVASSTGKIPSRSFTLVHTPLSPIQSPNLSLQKPTGKPFPPPIFPLIQNLYTLQAWLIPAPMVEECGSWNPPPPPTRHPPLRPPSPPSSIPLLLQCLSPNLLFIPLAPPQPLAPPHSRASAVSQASSA